MPRRGVINIPDEVGVTNDYGKTLRKKQKKKVHINKQKEKRLVESHMATPNTRKTVLRKEDARIGRNLADIRNGLIGAFERDAEIGTMQYYLIETKIKKAFKKYGIEWGNKLGVTRWQYISEHPEIIEDLEKEFGWENIQRMMTLYLNIQDKMVAIGKTIHAAYPPSETWFRKTQDDDGEMSPDSIKKMMSEILENKRGAGELKEEILKAEKEFQEKAIEEKEQESGIRVRLEEDVSLPANVTLEDLLSPDEERKQQ